MRQLKDTNQRTIEATALAYQTSIEYNNNEEENEIITEPIKSSCRITLQALASNSTDQNDREHVYSPNYTYEDSSSAILTPPPLRTKLPLES